MMNRPESFGLSSLHMELIAPVMCAIGMHGIPTSHPSEKLGKTGQNWAKLGKTGQNWAKLGKTGQNWATWLTSWHFTHR
jgi:hypothetical protein